MAKLFRSGLITASATFFSRVLGLIRDIFIAHLLGAGLCADVFFFSNRIPNFFRRLFAEGAFSQAFIPLMTEFKEHKSDAELNDLLSKTTGTLGVFVFLVTVLGMLGSSVVTALFGWGWFMDYLNNGQDAQKFIQASFLLKITFPYLFFITLTAVSGAVLNIYGKFAIPALTPCLLNISMICSCVFIAPYMQDANTALAWGVVIGGVIQCLFQLPFLYKLGKLLIPKFDWHHEGVVRIRKLMIPAIFGVSVSQLNLLINTMLASFLATGAISYLYYSDRLLEFPIGIFAVAISTVILPSLSKIDISKDHDKYVNTLDWGVRLVLFLGIPSMGGMIALKEPILRTIFMRGAFTADHVALSSASLLASVSGLCAMMLVRVIVQGFAAIEDTKTPVRCSVVAIFANIIFNLILVWPLDYIGLALSTALAAYVNISLLLYFLHKRKIYNLSKATILFTLKALIAGTALAVSLKYIAPGFDKWVEMTTLEAVLHLTLYVGIGGFIYILVCALLGIKLKTLRM